MERAQRRSDTDDAQRNLLSLLPPIQFQTPRIAPNPVVRRGLITRMRETPAQVVVLSGQAGSGKTTLLLQWAERQELPHAWLQLDPTHDDVMTLVVSLAATLARIIAMDPRIPGWATLAAPPLRERMIPALGTSLDAAPPFLLVIDDAHLVSSKSSWRVLESILDHFPAGARLGIGTRTEPGLPIGRLQAAGRLLEVGPDDLSFDVIETRELLRLRGMQADQETAAALHKATEGWAAGISLAVSVYDPDAGSGQWLAGIRGHQKAIARYLTAEVLQQQPKPVSSFLLETSILDRLSDASCRAVTGRSDAGQMLAHLEHDNLFIVALDDRGEWYRYHHLFAELLQVELARRKANRLPDLHSRAAAWYEGQAEWEAALKHWLHAGEVSKAAEIVCRCFFLCSMDFGWRTVFRWVGLFTDDQIAKSPDLTLLAGWLTVLTADDSPRGLAWILSALRQPPDDTPLLYGAGSRLAFQALLRSLLGLDGVTAMLKEAEMALELTERADAGWRCSAVMQLAVSRWLAGDDVRAEQGFRQAIREGASSNITAEIGAGGFLSLLLGEHGRWQEAESQASRALKRLEEEEFALAGPFAIVPLARARTLVHMGEPGVEARLEPVHSMLATGRLPMWMQVSMRVVLAQIALEQGDLDTAERWVSENRTALRGWPDAGIVTAKLERVSQLIRARLSAEPLTPQEELVLALLATHLSYTEIGAKLFVSKNTLKTHTRNLFRKLDAHTRTEAVERARKQGLLPG